MSTTLFSINGGSPGDIFRLTQVEHHTTHCGGADSSTCVFDEYTGGRRITSTTGKFSPTTRPTGPGTGPGTAYTWSLSTDVANNYNLLKLPAFQPAITTHYEDYPLDGVNDGFYVTEYHYYIVWERTTENINSGDALRFNKNEDLNMHLYLGTDIDDTIIQHRCMMSNNMVDSYNEVNSTSLTTLPIVSCVDASSSGGYTIPGVIYQQDVYTDPNFYQGVGTGYITNFLNTAWQGIQETNAGSWIPMHWPGGYFNISSSLSTQMQANTASGIFTRLKFTADRSAHATGISTVSQFVGVSFPQVPTIGLPSPTTPVNSNPSGPSLPPGGFTPPPTIPVTPPGGIPTLPPAVSGISTPGVILPPTIFPPVLSGGPSCGTIAKVTSRPCVMANTDSSGVPESLTYDSTNFVQVSGHNSGLLCYMHAPVPHLNYAISKILFYAAINDIGQIVSLSHPFYTDYTTLSTNRTIARCTPARVSTEAAPADEFVQYDIMSLGATRTVDNKDALCAKLATAGGYKTAEAAQTWYNKNRIGTIKYNPITQELSGMFLTTEQFDSLTRSPTAANFTGTTTIAFLPSDGINIYPPIELKTGQHVGWHVQGSGFATSTQISMLAEFLWDPTPRTYNYRSHPLRGNCNAKPSYKYTSNTDSLTGLASYGKTGQGAIALGGGANRPRARLPLSGPTIGHQHTEHSPRRYEVYNTKFDFSGRDYGFNVGGTYTKLYNVTEFYWVELGDMTSVETRIDFDMYSSDWTVAEFTDFCQMSGQQIAEFLNKAGRFTELSVLSAGTQQLQLVGFCTYNGVLTASDGSYYVAAIARQNPPTWCTPVTGNLDNFLVCTSGKELILPYLVSKTV